MRRALAIATALLLEACVIHGHLDRARPGHADVAGGAVTPRGVTVPPRDPGEDLFVVEAAGSVGWAHDYSAGDAPPGTRARDGAAFALELSPMWTHLRRSHSDTEAAQAVTAMPLRPTVGWTLLRTGAERGPRVGAGTLGLTWTTVADRVGPFFSVTAGATLDPDGPRAGPYGAACVGLVLYLGSVCGRLAGYLGHEPEARLYVSLPSFFEVTRSR